jgi:hypothetical protein
LEAAGTWLQGPQMSLAKSLTGRVQPGLEGVNPGVELCKSFGMLVEIGGGGAGQSGHQRGTEKPLIWKTT